MGVVSGFHFYRNKPIFHLKHKIHFGFRTGSVYPKIPSAGKDIITP